MKRLTVLIVLVLAVQSGLAAEKGLKKDIGPKAPPRTVNLPASEAVLEKGVEFQAAAQVVWPIPAAGAKLEIPLGLKVTNKTGKGMQLSVFDTVQITLKDANGNALKIDGGRNGTRPTRPLLFGDGDAQLVDRSAKLEWLKDGKSLRLIGDDGAGGIWYFDGLTAGKYTLGFTYECDAAKPDLSRLQPASAVIDPTVAPFWSGKAVTKELTVEVAEVKAAALPASEAVLENGAEFQATAQGTWPMPAPGAKTQINLGLKITNKTNMLMRVNVFDTVQLWVKDSNGKALIMGGGRKATYIPEPLLINVGESQTVSRSARLEWAADGKTLRLIGDDGAGGMWTVDGIKAGHYTVSFAYEATEEMVKPFRTRMVKNALQERAATYHLGKVTTKGLEIEVAEVKTASAR